MTVLRNNEHLSIEIQFVQYKKIHKLNILNRKAITFNIKSKI